MSEGELEGDAAAQGIAHDIRRAHAEVVEGDGQIVGHPLEAERPIDIRRAAMSLEVESDDLAYRRQPWQERRQHLDRAEAAVQQHEGIARSVYLVVERKAVCRRVADRLRLHHSIPIATRRVTHPQLNL